TKAPPNTKAGDKDAAAPASEPAFSTAAPNFRIRDNVLQFAVPVTVNTLGIHETVIVQTRGGFAKRGDMFIFEPDTLLVGSCPLQRLPIVVDFIRSRFVSAQQLPEDTKKQWSKLANVTIEGNVVKLKMP